MAIARNPIEIGNQKSETSKPKSSSAAILAAHAPRELKPILINFEIGLLDRIDAAARDAGLIAQLLSSAQWATSSASWSAHEDLPDRRRRAIHSVPGLPARDPGACRTSPIATVATATSTTPPLSISKSTFS